MLKDTLLSPSLESLNLSRSCLILLGLWFIGWLFGIFFGCFLGVLQGWVFNLNLFDSELHIVKVNDGKIDSCPFFAQISLAG
jgi:hypothetical protein